MRICLVLPYSWSFPSGVQRHVDSLAARLERQGHEVAVISPCDPPDFVTRAIHSHPGCQMPPERVRTVGRTLPMSSNGTQVGVACSPAAYFRVRRAVRKLRPDVVHVHEPLVPPVGWAAVRAAKSLDIPVVGTFHAHYTNGCTHYRVFRPLLAPIFRALDAPVAVSGMAKKTVADHFSGEFRVVPNGVDAESFAPGTSATRRDPHEVLFVGRHDDRKGLSVLLAAFTRLSETMSEAKLTIVGSRPEEVRLPEALLSSVEVRGVVSEEGLIRAMHSASVLCAPSVGAESFGMVLIEAMAAGLPVLASDIPGYDVVVTPGKDGVLVPPGDPGALASGLENLLRNHSLRESLSRAGISTARRYDWSRIAAAMEEVYDSVLGHEFQFGKNLAFET